MEKLHFDITSVLKEAVAMAKGIAQHVFVEERPQATQESMSHFVVVSLPQGLSNFGPYQKGVLRFELYARNRAGNQPDLVRLQSMLDSLLLQCPNIKGVLCVREPYIALKGEDRSGFNVWNAQCEVLVDTHERYDHLPKEENLGGN